MLSLNLKSRKNLIKSKIYLRYQDFLMQLGGLSEQKSATIIPIRSTLLFLNVMFAVNRTAALKFVSTTVSVLIVTLKDVVVTFTNADVQL